VDLDLGKYGGSSLTGSGGKGTLVAELPADSLVGASIVGLGESLTASYDAVVAASKDEPDLADFLDQADGLGLRLPADITALLGDETAVAVLAGDGDDPDVGARTRGGDPQRGLEVIQTVIASFSGADPADIPLDGIVEVDDDGLIAASNPDVIDVLAKDGRLGDTASFKNAVPNGDAPGVVYVNLAQLFATYGESDFDLSPTELKNVEPLDAVGLSAERDGFTMRVTFR
jgi:hypothetical protein